MSALHVTTSMEISMGHRLLGHEGKCAHLHGHNYIFEVSIAGRTNALGLVIDFTDLKKALKDILAPFDHAMVLHHDDPAAEILPMEKLVLLSVNPSAENLASLVYGKLVDRNLPPVRVVVRETSDGWATAEGVDRSVRIVATQ